MSEAQNVPAYRGFTPAVPQTAQSRAAGAVVSTVPVPAKVETAADRAAGVVYTPKPEAVAISLAQIHKLREVIHAFETGHGGSIGTNAAIAAPAKEILDAALLTAGERFEHNIFMSKDSVLDKQYGEVVPRGHKWDPATKKPKRIGE